MILALIAADGAVVTVPIGWPELGAGALLTLTVLLILTGRLVPARELRLWRDLALEEQRQKQELLDASRVTQEVLRALDRAASRGDDGT